MFDFHNLAVYQKARLFAFEVNKLIESMKADKSVKDQLKRASLSIMLNIAEGNSRFSHKDRKNFLVIARGSVFECVSVHDHLLDINVIDEEYYMSVYQKADELSRMLYSLILKFSDKNNSIE